MGSLCILFSFVILLIFACHYIVFYINFTGLLFYFYGWNKTSLILYLFISFHNNQLGKKGMENVKFQNTPNKSPKMREKTWSNNA